MSNAETLQRNNTRISENNTDLSSILDTVNNLPKAGAGFEINDCSYLFYYGAKLNQMHDILSLCKDVTHTSHMFAHCIKVEELDLNVFDTSKVTDMSNMFYYCQNLEKLKIDNFNTSSVTNMNNMFYYCNSGLITLDLSNFDTRNVNRMNNMFNGCKVLKDLNIGSFDASSVTNINSMFYNNKNLTNLTFMNNLGKGYTQKTANYSDYKLDLSKSTNLTYESLMDVINKLYDLNLSYNVANGGTLYRQQLVLGSTNLAKLQATEEGQQALAEADRKGWNVS